MHRVLNKKRENEIIKKIKNTLFLAKDLEEFENFLIPGDDYKIIANRSSEILSNKYPKALVYENLINFREYSTSNFFQKNLFTKNYFNISNFKYSAIWAYQAYPWLDDLKLSGLEVFTIDYTLFLNIKNKIFQHKMIDNFYRENNKNPILKNKIYLKTSIVSKNIFDYSYYKRKYETAFVLSCSNSDGGSCVFLINSIDDYNLALSKITSPVIKLEKYMDGAISVNQNAIVFGNGLIVSYQPSIQILQNRQCNNCFEYIGSDYNIDAFISEKVIKDITDTTYMIGKFLHSIGYRGIFGCDYIVKDNEHFFIEINPRYQASTFLLSLSSCFTEHPHFLHMYSFLYNDSPYEKNTMLSVIKKNSPSSYIKYFYQSDLITHNPKQSIKFDNNVHCGLGIYNSQIVSKASFPVKLNISKP